MLHITAQLKLFAMIGVVFAYYVLPPLLIALPILFWLMTPLHAWITAQAGWLVLVFGIMLCNRLGYIEPRSEDEEFQQLRDLYYDAEEICTETLEELRDRYNQDSDE